MDSPGAHAPTPHSLYLLRLGTQLLEPYTRLSTARAGMITGSAAEGVADAFSDLDMTVYYDGALPTEAELHDVRAAHGAPDREWLLGERDGGAIAEAYEWNGIQVQIGHVTIAQWESDIAEVVDRHACDTPLHKAMSGTLGSVTVAGAEWMDRWKARIASYPVELQQAMVRTHLRCFPIWYMPHVLDARDAALWQRQMLVEGGYNVLGILAGLNRRYFSPFQFKKMRRFLAGLTIVPDRCAERLDRLASAPPHDAVREYERLVEDTLALVRLHMPDIDVSAASRRLGQRRPPWNLEQLTGRSADGSAGLSASEMVRDR